jgi:hypothetical protein
MNARKGGRRAADSRLPSRASKSRHPLVLGVELSYKDCWLPLGLKPAPLPHPLPPPCLIHELPSLPLPRPLNGRNPNTQLFAPNQRGFRRRDSTAVCPAPSRVASETKFQIHIQIQRTRPDGLVPAYRIPGELASAWEVIGVVWPCERRGGMDDGAASTPEGEDGNKPPIAISRGRRTHT